MARLIEALAICADDVSLSNTLGLQIPWEKQTIVSLSNVIGMH